MQFCVGTISYRGCHPSHAMSMLRLISEASFSTYLHRRGDWLVERARSIVATHFLTETTADVLLWIDSDIVFEPKDAVEICEQAMDYSVIGGLYMMRHAEQVSPAARVQEPMALEGRPRPVRADWVGTGFLAAHRRVFEALVQRDDMVPCRSADDPPFWPFYYPMMPERDGSRLWLGEDVSFCHRAREAGFEVYVNPAIQVTHMGGREYRVADMVPGRVVATAKRVIPHVSPDGRTTFRLDLRPLPTPDRAAELADAYVDLEAPVGAGAI